jgi:uncharacterized protein DUF4038/collagenase-like protein with putative collagen-binding domain
VDSAGKPWPILGRTAWFITSLAESDWKKFVDDTAAKGFTAIEFHAINHDPRGRHPPFDGGGSVPFTRTLDGAAWTGSLAYSDVGRQAPDFTKPDESYWRRLDALLAYLESRGLVAFMFPAYVGFKGGDQGWMQEMVANGPSRVQAYGAFIANRYRQQKNLVWMAGGDKGEFNAAEAAVESSLLQGMQGVGGQQSLQFSAEWSGDSIATDQPTFGKLMTLNGAYSWEGSVVAQGRRAYAHEPTRPAFLLEEPYDEEGPDGNGVNPSATQPVRKFQWWGWLSTIGGYIAGNGYVWPFKPGWESHLDTRGARDLARLNAFVRSIEWHRLVPSGLGGMKRLAGGSPPGAGDHVAAAATPDGTLLVAYVPPVHWGAVAIDMTALSSPARARWFNPWSGAFTPIGEGLPNDGVRRFTPPGDNGSDWSDWVLVLDAAAPGR